MLTLRSVLYVHSFLSPSLYYRTIDHLIRLGPYQERADIRRFYHGTQLCKRKHLKSIPEPKLNRDSRRQLNMFAWVIAAIDPSVEWDKDDSSEDVTIVFTGSPLFETYIMGSISTTKHAFEVRYDSSGPDLEVNDTDYAYMARSLFYRLSNLAEAHDKRIMVILKGRKACHDAKRKVEKLKKALVEAEMHLANMHIT